MNKITFTQYKSPDPLTKRLWLEDGVIHKQAAAHMTKGTATRVTMPFADFANALTRQTDKQACGYGVHALSFPDKVQIATKAREKLDKRIISRSKANYQYGGAGVEVLDHDPSLYGQSFTPDALLAELFAIHPEIEQAARIVRGSVSAGVHKTGEAPLTDKGFHIYLPVLDATLLTEYGALLTSRLWLAGHGFIALSANGALLERSCIDSAVFSPERLDFVGKPIISGTGLEYTPPEIIYTEGGMLDIATLPPLTEEEAAEVAALKANAKNSIKPLAAKKTGEWKEEKISTMIAEGSTREKATESINKILSGGCRDLYADFVLEFSDGVKATVNEVLRHPKDFDGKALADPIEGVAYGRTTAIFYFNKGKPVINSLAHGQSTQYFLHESVEAATTGKLAWVVKLDAHVETWNKTRASTSMGGKHRIMELVPGSSTPDGRDCLTFWKRNELSLSHDHTLIQTGVNKYGEPTYSNHVMAWAKNTNCRAYTGGVVFLPGRNAPANYFNTWSGFSIEPKRSDALLARIHYHMKEVVCAGHQDLYDYMVNWIAYSIQYPDKPAGAALVLRGEKGSGKGTLGHFLKNIWGNHGLHIANAKHLVGNFNAHLNDVCFLFADEAFFSGDKQHEGVLKALVTEPTVIVERKGIDAVSQPNYLKIFMATNAAFAVPASRDERRYCVLDVSSAHIKDKPYFDALHSDCASKDVRAAFLYQMQCIDLTGWNTGMIPDSVGLREQRYHSMNSVQKWIVDALINESFGIEAHGDYWQTELNSKELFARYVSWCDTGKAGEYRRLDQCQVSKYLGEVFDKKNHVGGRDKRGYVVGSIEDAIARFEAYEKISLSELVPAPND